jgi:hypothetical protein
MAATVAAWAFGLALEGFFFVFDFFVVTAAKTLRFPYKIRGNLNFPVLRVGECIKGS